MKKFLALIPLCALSWSASAVTLPIFDPFADATASNGTAYADFTPLNGQINAQGDAWIPINTNQNSGIILLNSYAFTNYAPGSALPTPTGTEAAQVNAPGTGSGQGVRLNLADVATNGISNGTVYASMYLRCTDISALSPYSGTSVLGGGVFNMAFSDGVGSTATLPTTQVCGRWYFRKSPNDAGQNHLYNIGTSKVAGPTGTGNPTAYWDSRDFTTDDELFVVVGYSFNPAGGTNDDTVKLWVNPDPASLGQASEPATTVQGGTSPADTDAKTIGSFNVMVRSTLQVTSMLIDEVRIGTSWADVTAPHVATVPVPTLTISKVDPNTVQLSWRGDSTGYTLQGTSTLLSSGTPWANLGGSASTSGTNFIQNDTVSGMKFYRLIK